MMRTGYLLATSVIVLALCAPLLAGNVDLVTVPKRDTVQLTIYNSEDLTLVKETRHVTVKKGLNKLQFSWANTLIDPTSVEFRPLTDLDKVEVLDTTFSGQKPQSLIWNIRSQIDGQIQVEVTYFTSGLSWSMDYVGVCNPEETEMKFTGFVQVSNSSGEAYEDAQVRLIVGKVNLVEKIAELARRAGVAVPEEATAPSAEFSKLKRTAAKEAFETAERAEFAGKADQVTRPKEVAKEGISEYFMFTIEGTETIANGWSRRMRALRSDLVKFDVLYRMRSHQYGPRPVRFFLWQNDTEHGLGESPLPDGLIRLFRDDGKGDLSYLGQLAVQYVPVRSRIEVNLGPDDLVVYDSQRTTTRRSAFAFDSNNNVNGWDEKVLWVDTVRNYRARPVAFELRRVWDGDVDYESEVATTLFDSRTTETRFTVKLRDKFEYPCTTTVHQGANQKQARVRLKP